MAKQFCIEVKEGNYTYECKVMPQKDKESTYYHVDILSPTQKQINGHFVQPVYNIEMRMDCDNGELTIKEYTVPVPAELKQIEKKLSAAICNCKK